jgi:hypothetical protein
MKSIFFWVNICQLTKGRNHGFSDSNRKKLEWILKMLWFWQIVNFSNWEILAFKFFQTSLKPITLRKQVKFSVLSIFEEKFYIRYYLEFFEVIFPKKWVEKSIHKNDISKSVFLNIFNFCHILYKYERLQIKKKLGSSFTGFQNGGDFQYGWKIGFLSEFWTFLRYVLWSALSALVF